MNKRFQLVLHEVKRKFISERAFYHSILGITQRAWEKYKNGETNFENIKLDTYKKMMTSLFTPYEEMLIDQAIQATNFNWYENVIDAFHDIKMAHAKVMLERGAAIETETRHMEDGEKSLYKSITVINVVDEINLKNINQISFQIYPNGLPHSPEHMHLRMPSGHRNRKEWFNNYIDEVVVK